MLGAALAIAAASLLHCSSSSSSSSSSSGSSGGEEAGAPEEGGAEDDGAAPSSCPVAGAASTTGTITAPEVKETSGIVQSARNPGVFWVHNDSGDTARVFAVKADGTLLATLAYDTAKPTDVEDIAIEDVSADQSFLYLGDIGDNAEARAQLTIHRVAEPKLGGSPGAQLTATSEKMTVTYADGPHNAETLLFDPVTKDLFIATKKTGGPSAIHRVGPFTPGGSVKTEKIASVAIDLATGGEISRDGRLVAIRNYGPSAFVWPRAEGETLTAALSRAPCKLPIMKGEPQGEAFAFLAANDGYVTISEGASPELHVTMLK